MYIYNGVSRIMKVLKYFWRKTLCGRICATISSGYRYILVSEHIGQFLRSPEFQDILKKYLHIDFDEDWIGRLYGVINPYIDIDENFNMSSVIVSLDGTQTNNRDQVENWISKQLSLIYQLFKLQKVDMFNLFQEISIDFRHVGPANHENYLIVLDLVQRKDFTTKLKKMLIHLMIYSILAIIIFMIFF